VSAAAPTTAAVPDALHSDYWSAVDARTAQLTAYRCTQCDTHFLPRVMTCTTCGATEFERAALSPHGTLYTYTVLHNAGGVWPAVYAVGCAGVITHAERLPDGRSNVVLRGLEKFRIVEEDHSRAYRVATIDPLPETTSEADRPLLRQQRQRLETLLIAAIERGGADPRFPPAIADDDLINALAQYLALSPVERQALLERDGILARCRGLIDLLEMKNFTPPSGWGNGSASGVH